FTDAMIDAMARLPNVLKYIDMPLQHASDRMLELMRRRTSAAHTQELLAKLRARVPGIALRTTFIVGHPGETEADFAALLDFVRENRFDMVGCFKYSPEDGTPSGTMHEDTALRVPPEEAARREEALMLLQQEIAFERNEAMATERRKLPLLVDGPDPENEACKGERVWLARAPFQAPQVDSVTRVIARRELSPGELVDGVVTEAMEYDLVARLEDEMTRRVSLPVARRGH
ncbi:MAG: radical SAM protein, partial [Planctomycetota bacterium]